MRKRKRTEEANPNRRRSGGRLRPSWRVAAAATALSLAGCSGVRGELVETQVDQVPSDRVELTFADPGDREEALFAFTAPELFTGTRIDGLDLHNDAPLVMTFVVPSCAVCVVEAPKLASAAEANGGVNFVVVHSFGEVDGFLEYADQYNLSSENTIHLVDIDGTLWDRFGIYSQPSSILVDESGRVTSSRGALGDDGLLRAISTVTGQDAFATNADTGLNPEVENAEG